MASRTVFETAFNAYKVRRQLGQGGAGIVYEVEDEESNLYALKSLNPGSTRQKVKRFGNELAFCQKNNHPHVIKVLDSGFSINDGQRSPFYVMDLYPSTLRKIMDEGISPEAVLPLFLQILDGVEAAHLQGIWHRDLKPKNILVDDGARGLVVADFGIAHFSEDELKTIVETSPQERLANFQYAAPEQKISGQPVDHRADIFALGMILNEMFTGVPPEGTDYKRIGQVSSDFEYLDDLVDQMMRQNPVDRPTTIGDIKKQLIARGNEFVSLQKLSRLKSTVIKESEIDDDLVNNPVELTSVDYKDETMFFTLSQRVTPNWVGVFRNIKNYSAFVGSEPSTFLFKDDVASTRWNGQDAQTLIDYFKEYLTKANAGYREYVERGLRETEREERLIVQRQIDEEEKRRRILGNLNI